MLHVEWGVRMMWMALLCFPFIHFNFCPLEQSTLTELLSTRHIVIHCQWILCFEILEGLKDRYFMMLSNQTSLEESCVLKITTSCSVTTSSEILNNFFFHYHKIKLYKKNLDCSRLWTLLSVTLLGSHPEHPVFVASDVTTLLHSATLLVEWPTLCS